MVNWKDETMIQTFVYYLVYSGARKAFCKIMQHKQIWFFLSFAIQNNSINFLTLYKLVLVLIIISLL